MASKQFNGTGRRKSSKAGVFLTAGSGNMIVNGRPVDEYFARPILVMDLKRPLKICKAEGDYDIKVTVRGGGSTGQAGAIRLGLARALAQANHANRAPLKREGLLTRDARKVERKKYGQPGARRRFQFSKR